MIDGLVIQKLISFRTASSMIKLLTGSQTIEKPYAFSKDYEQIGFPQMMVWANPQANGNDVFKTSTIKLTVDVNHFAHPDGYLDPLEILAQTQKLLDDYYINDGNKWSIKKLEISRKIESPYASKYLEYINSGRSLRGNMVKGNDCSGSGSRPSAIKYVDGKLIAGKYTKIKKELTFHVSNDDSLDMGLLLDGNTLRRHLGNDLREFDFEAAENYFWFYYIKRISGVSDYYSLNAALRIIETKVEGSTTREKYETILKGAAQYKGIEPYLKHVKNGDVRYNSLYKFKRVQTANNYIKKLQDELGINPVIISRRDASLLKVKCIPSIINALGIPHSILEKRKRRNKAPKAITVTLLKIPDELANDNFSVWSNNDE